MIVVKVVESEDFSHKCEIECPICRVKIKGNYGCYKLKAARWYTNFARHCTDVHVNIKDIKTSRKRSCGTSQTLGQTKITEIFKRKNKNNIDIEIDIEPIDESSDEEVEYYSDDEPLAKRKKTKPIPEVSGEQ